MSRYGRYAVTEPLHNLALVHRHDGRVLHEVTWEPPLAVLDQQDLVAQGITVAELVPGARAGTDALGSCTANATTAAMSCLGQHIYDDYVCEVLTLAHPGFVAGQASFSDAKTGEEAAIAFYHACTDQTGTTSTEWPPTDCGSSGPYIAEELLREALISSQRIAHGPQDLVSLLQDGPVLMGSPFFNAWETPNGAGFVDGDGSAAALEDAVRSGVAGGHETLICAVESIGEYADDPVVLRVRNSWSKSWGDDGDFRIHLSTLAMLGSYCDFRALVA